MRKIKFIVDFATKIVGDEWECDSMLAAQLVYEDQVAEYIDAPTESNTTEAPAKKSKKSTAQE